MLSQATMKAIEKRGWNYILGVRMRGSKEFRGRVLGSDAVELTVSVERAHKLREPDPGGGDPGRGQRRREAEGSALRGVPERGAGAA